jgi:hypothetical protein
VKPEGEQRSSALSTRSRRRVRSLYQAVRERRFALAAFLMVEIAALPLLAVLGRGRWFWNDDWAFLSQRMEIDVETLFRNYYNHWSTLPNLAYWAVWSVVGARYRVYQLLIIVSHLVAVALLRAVMRRAGVGPWIANVAALTLLFFGFGAENIVVAFQIVLVGSLVFGLTQLILADHDGGIDWRDWLGLVAGLAGLMCSNVAIAMVAAVGIATLWRRGWRIALFHTAPLAAIYAAWWLSLGDNSGGDPFGASIGEVVRFVAIGVGATFRGLGYFWIAGLGLGAVLVTGLVYAISSRGREELKGYATPMALLLGAVLFLIVTGIKRANPALEMVGPALARRSRYIYVTGAMTLPALAIAADALVRRWRQFAVFVVALLLIGLPGNVHRLDTYQSEFPWRTYRREILVLARAPLAARVPPATLVPIDQTQRMTVGWLVAAARSGELPTPTNLKPDELATASLAVALKDTYPMFGTCHWLQSPTTLVLRTGDRLGVKSGAISVEYTSPDGGVSRPRSLVAPAAVTALAGPLSLNLAPTEIATTTCS